MRREGDEIEVKRRRNWGEKEQFQHEVYRVEAVIRRSEHVEREVKETHVNPEGERSRLMLTEFSCFLEIVTSPPANINFRQVGVTVS